ncbi:FAS1 domain-containing protein [Entophlyctis helioformis]|nr:FAS1 domain-containing protein [Entophlyctis helioformis]
MQFSTSLFAAAALLVSSASAQTALQIAAGNKDFSTLVSLAAKYPGIVSVLNGTTPITVFAPTNAAFTKLSTESPALFKTVTEDAKLLETVLTYHVLAGTVFDPTKAAARNFVKTAQGSTLRADVAKEGVTLAFGLGTSKVAASAPASNGVVHIVDTVLTPPGSASSTAVAAGLTSLAAALTKVDFISTVDGLKDVTIFAPTNKAFDDLNAFAAKNNLTITDSILSAVLNYHIVKGTVYSTDVVKAKAAKATTAYNGASVDVALNGTDVTVKGAGNTTPAKVVVADVLVAGGVVHVVDTVILPDLAKIVAGSGKNGINLPSFTAPAAPYTPKKDDKPAASPSPAPYYKDEPIYSGANKVVAGAVGAVAAAAAALLF